MRKSLKVLLYSLLALALIFLITISIVPLIFDPNDYKFEITQAALKHTGRNLDIAGDLKLQILPKLAVTTGKIILSNAEGFSPKTFAEIESGYFRVRLIPLFSKQIEIKKIVLNGAKLHLIRRQDGQTNWKGLRGSSNNSGKGPIPIRYKNLQPGRANIADSRLAALLESKIDVFNAKVTFDDQVSGNRIVLKNFDFILDRFGFGRGIDFRIRGKLKNSKPVFRETATINGRIFVSENLDSFKIEDFYWNSRIKGDFLPAEFRQAELTATAEINLAAHTLSVTNLRLITGNTSVGANLSATRIFESPKLEGQISIQQANPSKLINLRDIKYTPQDPSALQSLNGDFSVVLNESRLVMKDIALVLDGNPIKGVATIAGFESPKIKFNFSTEHLDADRYLPKSGTPPLPAKLDPPHGISVVDVERSGSRNPNTTTELTGTNVQGILNLGSLRYRGLLAEGVQMALHFSNGVVRSNQRFKKFYGGRLKGSIEFNNRARVPVIALNQNLSDVQIGPLLQDLNGKKPIEGTLESTIRLVGHGADLQAFKSTLNGDIDATVTNGQIVGVNLDRVIRDSKTLMAEIGLAPASKADITRFSTMTYKAAVVDGVIDNSVLEANSTNFDFSGSGKINLTNEAVDYRIEALVNDNPAGIAGIKIKELQGVRIPIQIGGTLTALTFQPGVKSALDDPKIKAAAKNLKRKLEKKLGSGPRRIFENLF